MKKLLYRNLYLILASDIVLITFSWYLSHLLRFNFEIPSSTFYTFYRLLPIIIGIKIVSFVIFDLYRGMWRYTSLTDLGNIIKASSFGSLLVVLMIVFVHGFTGLSRSVFIIDWFLTLLLISGSRIAIRIYFWSDVSKDSGWFKWRGFFPFFERKNRSIKRLLIIGAGDCGEKIFREIHDNPNLGYQTVGFADDNPAKENMRIHGVPVLGNTDELRMIVEQMDVEELVIAIPSASSSDMRHIVARCEESGLPYKTVPSMSELINGKVTVKAIRDVAYEDLLGRELVKLDEKGIGEYIKGRRVLVTGAGGSIGSELCRQVCRFGPESIILYERAESPLYEIELELRDNFPDVRVVPKLADILEKQQLERAFGQERPDVVFHSAAYKHVPMLELQPWEAVINNILGTRNVIEKAKEFKVGRFVYVSTDKAVRPANVMGASKRVAEMLIQAQNGCGVSKTRFMTVRFGNVAGSVGSVVPLFKKQIEKGGPVTVTHPEITRYFMTIPEACQLILQAGSMGSGGEIFILDMGTPIKIADMARDLIKLSGFEPDVDIEITYMGLRPGEKLREELITEGEGIIQTSHEKIMVIKGPVCNIDAANGKVDELIGWAASQDGDRIKRVLKEVLPEYRPVSQ